MKTNEAEQRKLKKFLERRHPEYAEMLPHWEFLEDCYEGGREWFKKNIFRYIKEGEGEYADRLERAYRFNHTREVVDLVDKYLFKMEIVRSQDAPESVKRFWEEATLNRKPISDYAKTISRLSSTYGRVWVVVDTLSNIDSKVASKADEKEGKVRTYSYTVEPEHALDMSFDDEGELNWILIHEQVRDDEDPLESSGKMIDRYRLWEREHWTLFIAHRDGKKVSIEVDGPHKHGLGFVPVFAANNTSSDEPYCAPALIDDIAYLDRAVANYLSNLDAIIQDQTFSQLVIPAQGLAHGEDAHGKLVEMGTKRAFTYDAEGGGRPEYISPDVKQAQIILAVISKIINEIYHTVGLAGERTKEDNSQGIDNSSGVAKAYDFERVNSLLAAKADSLEHIENKLARFVAAWSDEEVSENLVHYPDNFDVRGLHDEFGIASQLSLIAAPDSVRRQQMEAVIDKLFPKLKKDLKDKMLAELKTWPPKPEVIDPVTGKSVAPKDATGTSGSKGEVMKKSTQEAQAKKSAKKPAGSDSSKSQPTAK